jgi:hypothetical protein
MPKFLDHHATMPEVAPETAQEMASRIKAGKPDQFGVTGLNVFMCANGEGYCLSEAPDADAVVKAHQALGFPLSRADVVEVTTIA